MPFPSPSNHEKNDQKRPAPFGLTLSLKTAGLAGLVSAIRPRIAAGILACLFAAIPCEAGLKIYYIRHAEFGQNVVKQYKNVPKDQWPSYVGDSTAVTPKGREQIVAVAGKLKPYQFDFIACSPIYRCRQTILPFLRDTERTAEIWPELAEFGDEVLPLFLKETLPVPGKNLLGGGRRVNLPDDEKPFFTLRPGGERLLKLAPKTREHLPQRASDIKSALQNIVAMLRQKAGGTGQSVLLSGHGNNGRVLLQVILPQARWPKKISIVNTGVWMVEELPDGTFALRMLNDEPVDEAKIKAAKDF